DRLLAAPCELKQRSAAIFRAPRDRSRPEQVAGAHRATAHGMMCELLSRRVIQIFGVGPADRGRVAALGRQRDCQPNIEIVGRRFPQVGKEWLYSFRYGNAEWFERFAGDDPRTDGGCERLRLKRAERLVLPGLD